MFCSNRPALLSRNFSRWRKRWNGVDGKPRPAPCLTNYFGKYAPWRGRPTSASSGSKNIEPRAARTSCWKSGEMTERDKRNFLEMPCCRTLRGKRKKRSEVRGKRSEVRGQGLDCRV